ncbi:MAG TPA: hypothetical protein PKC91_02205 [Ignavibacteria bacterium]|nr:hypothetical protein [Ignavibacteria bacterium]
MFENFVFNKIENENLIFKELLETIPADEHLTRMHILNSNLSDFTKNYLLYEFNERGTEEEFTQKISKSNKLYFNYTIRPKWTLQTFLFNNFESRPPSEIVKKLNLFTFYSFYSEAIKDFITDNFQIFITKGEVTSIIDHTNEAIRKKLTVDINNAKIKNFLLQIFLLKYESESNYNLESSVPFSFIEIFLEDKSFTDLENKFSVIKGLTGDSEISLKDIIKVLTDKYNVPEKSELNVSAEVPVKKAAETPVVKEEVKISEIKKEPSIPEAKKEDIVISQKVRSEVTVAPDSKKNVKVKPDDKSIRSSDNIYSAQLIEADKESDQLKAKTESDKSFSESRKEIIELFNEKQMEKILSKVYGSDLIYKDKSFNKLSNYKTWFEASKHLKEIFIINQVDLYNKDIISFVNILNDYFKKRE